MILGNLVYYQSFVDTAKEKLSESFSNISNYFGDAGWVAVEQSLVKVIVISDPIILAMINTTKISVMVNE